MKKLLTFTNVIGAVAIMLVLVGCASTTSNNAAITESQKEMMLTQAGFKSIAVTTPAHQQQLSKLAVDKVSAVKNQGKLYYVYPTARKDQILIGRQAQFDSYKKMLSAQVATTQQTSTAQQAQGQNTDGAYLTGETAGPYRVSVEYFDGFGPIQDNPAWQ